MKTNYHFVTAVKDRHGKIRYRFRRKGYASHYLKSPFGTKDFEREYAALLSGEPLNIGLDRVRIGTVDDVISRYYSDHSFLSLKPSTKTVYRGVLEGFRATFGGVDLMKFDAKRIQQLMTAMAAKPHAAARLRKLLAQLFIVARREKLVPHGFDPVKDTKPPKVTKKGGYHRITEAELDIFEAAHPLGTKPRLAYALLLYGAQRSGDSRLMTMHQIQAGRIQITQEKTGNHVDIPVVRPLAEAVFHGPIGARYILESNRGVPFTQKGFYNLLKRAFIKAGLPHCTPHGLRKSAARRVLLSGAPDEDGMLITGHASLEEYRYYAGPRPTARIADAVMDGVMSNLAKRLDMQAQ